MTAKTNRNSFSNDFIALKSLNIIYTKVAKCIPIKNGKRTALRILDTCIEYARCHTPYKSFWRVQNDIKPYHYHKPFNIVKKQLSNYETSDDLIGNLMDDGDYLFSIDTNFSFNVFDALNSLENRLSKKKNYYKIFKKFDPTALNPKDYHPLTKKDMLRLLTNIKSKVQKYNPTKKDIESSKLLKKLANIYKN